jgi:hypothetical protein
MEIIKTVQDFPDLPSRRPRDEQEAAVCLSLFWISYNFAVTAGWKDRPAGFPTSEAPISLAALGFVSSVSLW